MTAIVIIVLVALVCPSTVKGTTSRRLEWHDVSDGSALCNDFTRAGYFLRRENTSDRWIIFLESGGLCYSNETCNRRFFVTEVSRRFDLPPSGESQQNNVFYENFDPAEAWNETVVSGREAAVDVVSPYMTSMRCFENKTDYFPQGFSVDGTDILDRDCKDNPLFCDYNHVVIPYCSSDLWLGTEVDGTRNNTAANGECTQCFDYNQQNGCFRYSPRSESIQFTYRGRTIFMSVIRDLLAMGMDGATEVVLAGSSAGGLGALNNAKWLQSELQSVGSAELVVIFDSAWFINFQGSIYQIFDGTLNHAESEAQRQNVQTLLSLLESNEACADVRLGLPCCSSPFCLFTQTNAAGERYYPEVPTFGIFSLYDAYLLAPSLAGLETVPNSGEISVGYGIDFLLTVGEYGGEMNNTVVLTDSKTTFFSYYATQCLQHVYLATSTLWGLPGASVFGRATVELERDSGDFTHLVEAGIWKTHQLAGPTIQQALMQWYSKQTVPMHFRDNCSGLHCNNQCPETFTLGELDSDDWPPVAKAIIAALVLGVTILCLLAKGLCLTWLYYVQRKQRKYNCLEGDKIQEKQSVASINSPNSVRVGNPASASPPPPTTDRQVQPIEPVHNYSGEGDKTQEKQTVAGIDGLTSDSAREGNSSPPPPTTDQQDQPLETACDYSEEGDRTEKKQASLQDESETDDISVSCLDLCYKVTVRNEDKKNDRRTMHTGIEKLTCGRWKPKEILKGISTYFNYGELTGIMGASGSGKTTFLNLLTGRQTSPFTGEIRIDGQKMEGKVQESFVANTGYLLQLATPYYEELTVRDNLTLAAEMKLNELTREEKFGRVNYVMKKTEIFKKAETPVNKLSGGEKRHLSVAMQLLTLPKIMFLDEPTSGLDAKSAIELLIFLNELLALPSDKSESPDDCTGRAIVLTIHQPSLKIFLMFDKLVLLSEGKIAYNGPPHEVSEKFGQLRKRFAEEQGPLQWSADTMMEMFGDCEWLQLITEDYEHSSEKKTIEDEIKTTSFDGKTESWSERSPSYARLCRRLAVLEARASKRTNIWQTLYFLFIFVLYGVLLGTVYLQQTNPFLVLSGFAAFSFASSLVMFPMLHLYYIRALEIFSYEYRDGVGNTRDLVFQGFCRAIFLVTIPVVICTTVLYLLIINKKSYNFAVYGQVVIVNLALNQTWTALTIFMICASPNYSVYLSSIVTSIAGFTAGFFIPIEQIPWWYRWLAYINPNYYGFSATAFLLLNDFKTGCTGSQFECYASSGEYFLEQFTFENINPYAHTLALLGFTALFLVLAWFFNWIQHNYIYYKIQKFCQHIYYKILKICQKKPREMSGAECMESGQHQNQTATDGSEDVPERALLSQSTQEDSARAEQTETDSEVVSTGQCQAMAEQEETNTSEQDELESSADTAVYAAKLARLREEIKNLQLESSAAMARLHEENRSLQEQIQELEAQKNEREVVPMTQKAKKLPQKGNWKRTKVGATKSRIERPNNIRGRTAGLGTSRANVHPFLTRQTGARKWSTESGAAVHGAAEGRKHSQQPPHARRGKNKVHPQQPHHAGEGRQPAEAESSRGNTIPRVAEGGTDSATSPENVDASDKLESMKQLINRRQRLMEESIEKTQKQM